MGFKETNYVKFTDWKNQDYKLTEDIETFGIMDSDPTRYFEFEDILIKAQEENDSEGMEKAALMFTLLSVKQLVKRIPNNTKVIDIQNNIRLKFSNLYPTLIFPVTQSLKEEGYIIDENTTFNTDEAIKYIDRVLDKGEYTDTPQGRRYKLLAFKRMFNLGEEQKPTQITEYKARNTLTTDFSDRMNVILKVLKKQGTKELPATEEKNGFTVYKNGNPLDDSDIELFHYLIGELEEHGCETEITFRRSDLINNMGYRSLRGNKLDNLTSSLMNLNAQAIAIVDTRNDKIGKKLDKINLKKFKGTQLLRADIIGEDDEILIKFTSPFSKYFREQKQFGRILSRDMLNKYLYTNTRILKIARELSRMSFIANQRNKKNVNPTINFDTLIKNIGEEEKYNNHSNKRVFLQRLTKDIEIAISYIDNLPNYKIIKPTPRTIKNGKIELLK